MIGKNQRKKFKTTKQVQFISISRDSSEVAAYHEKYNFPFESIIGEEIWEQYGIVATPTLLIVDQSGVIQYRKSGNADYLEKRVEKLLED